ncbi:uncharacterized protein TNIN_66181 [Trichonephila inaurata madagascariensis]|uniref:Uncharacterized protein n=1 Tax=Trichonephila inaurata madagascariensis TaxID=2747483 RepID=A0A8X6XZ04_9ARAC|nr:uncharacterized protein TNIN_66181 [Trichonephila inaurata madagascariensis]
MPCPCVNINCHCKILCYCSKKSCLCEKCSTLIHRLCNICGLPFDSADQAKSENVCSCFIRESTICSETSQLSKPEKIVCYVPVPVFYPLPIVPSQFLPPTHRLPNEGMKTNQPVPRSLEFGISSSNEPSNNSTSDHRVSSKGSGPVLKCEQLPSNERNISLPAEETNGSSSNPAIGELDKNSDPHERPHLSTVPENYDLLKEQFRTSTDLSELVSKNHGCANRNKSKNSPVRLVDLKRSAKVMSRHRPPSEKSEPRRDSNLVAPSKDVTWTDPSVGNVTQSRKMEQDVAQFIALKNQRSVPPETLLSRLNLVHAVPLMNQPDPGSINFKVPVNRDLVSPSQSNLVETEMCSSLESFTFNNPANTPEASCIHQNSPVSLWYESWHPEPYNKSSLEPVKRLVDRTFNNQPYEPISNTTDDVKYRRNDFQSAKWAHYTRDWLDSLPPTYL